MQVGHGGSKKKASGINLWGIDFIKISMCLKSIVFLWKYWRLTLTFKTFTTSGGNCMRAVLVTFRYILSTNIPARIACATERNFGFSSAFRRVVASWRVKVEASHSRTSGGTASGCTSESSSSSSASRLRGRQGNGWVGGGGMVLVFFFFLHTN